MELSPEVKDKNERIGMQVYIAIRVYVQDAGTHTHIRNAEDRGSPLARSSNVLWYAPIPVSSSSVRKVSGEEV